MPRDYVIMPRDESAVGKFVALGPRQELTSTLGLSLCASAYNRFNNVSGLSESFKARRSTILLMGLSTWLPQTTELNSEAGKRVISLWFRPDRLPNLLVQRDQTDPPFVLR